MSTGSSSSPVWDIVVPIHNQGSWVDLCIRAVEHHARLPYRLILVNNASTEGKCLEVLQHAENSGGHTVIHSEVNKSFSLSVNTGVQMGSAPNVMILNDDCVVTPGFDVHMLQDLTDPTVGMTGARSNYASGRQGMGVLFDDAPFLVFVCVGIKRKLYEEIGPLDGLTYDGFSTEDLDYSYRVKWCASVVKDGVKTLQKSNKPLRKLRVSEAFVLHAGSQTLQEIHGPQENMIRNNEKYMLRLQQHWGKDFVAKQTKITPKVLVCSFSAEEHTRVNFMLCLLALKTGPMPFSYWHFTRLPIHIARQLACEKALNEGFDFLMMVDDDMIFNPDTLTVLARHMQNPDVNVVNALAYGRKPPYSSCAYEQAADGLHYNNLEGWENRGLLEVAGTGLSCCLIRTDALKVLDTFYVDKLSDAEKADHVKLAEAQKKGRKLFGHWELLGEDLYFCKRMKDAGLKVHCDFSMIIGHVGEPEIVASRVKQAYMQKLAQSQGLMERVSG